MAATNLGSLSIDLVVNIGNFIEPINQAERKAKSASETIGQSFKTIGSTMKSVGDFMNNQIVAGLTSTVTRVIDTGSEIKKLAQLANTSTSSFQYYAKGAETVGISMDKFANQLKGMQQNIGNFQQTGGGPLADFFKNIAPQVGVTISQFQKLSGPDALQLYYDSLVKANVSQESMRFYMEALISDSTALIPLLENGGAGFKKWGDTAQKAGSIMDDAMIKKLSQAKENLQIMDLQWQGVQATMVNGIMPVFIAVTSHMDTITAAAVGLGAALSVKLAVQAAMVAKEFAMWAIEGVRTVATFASVTAASLETTTAMGVLRGAMAFLGGPVGLGLLAVQALAAGAAFLFMKNSNDEAAKSLNEQGVSIAEIVKKYQELDTASQRTQMRAEKKSLEELNQEYEKSKGTLISMAIAIGRLDGSTTEASRTASELAMKFKEGQMKTSQFASEINKLSGVSEKSKARIDEQAAASIKVGQEFTKQKEVINSLLKSTDEATKKQGNLNKEFYAAELASNRAKVGYEQYQKTFNTEYKDVKGQQALFDKYGKKFSSEQMEKVYEWGKRYNYDSAQMATPTAQKDLKASLDLLNLNKELKSHQEDKLKLEQRSTEEAKKQAELAKKQAMASAVMDPATKNMLSVYQAFMNTGVLNEKQAKYFTAEVGRENDFRSSKMFGSHKDHNNGFTNVGFFSWQKDRATDLMSFLSKKGLLDSSGNIKPTQEALNAQAKYAIINEIFTNKRFTKSKKALMKNADYKELESTVGNNFIGWDYDGNNINARPHHKKRDNYYNKINLLLGKNGDESYALEALKNVQNSDDEQYQASLTQAANEKALKRKYYTEPERILADSEDDKAEIIKTFPEGPERTRLLALRQKEYDKAMESYIAAEDEKIRIQNQAIQGTKDRIDQINQSTTETWARTTLTPDEMKKWNLQNEFEGKQTSLWDGYQNINESINSNENLSETDKYQMLEDAHQAYVDAKFAMDVEYDTKSRELQNSLNVENLNNYATMFGDMAGLAKAFGGEQSNTYRTLFAMQKGFSLASVILSSSEAIGKAWASAAFPYNIPAVAMAVAQTGVLKAAVSAVTPQGFATGGQIRGLGNGLSDSIPIWASNEEFMIKQSSAKKIGLDNLNYMNQTGELPQTESSQIIVPQLAELPPTGSAINAPVSVNVTVNSDGSSQVDSSGQYKLVGEVLGNTIRQVLLQELRQGRILYNAIRG
ncbi:hypothetical protein ACJBLD_10860 [Acinetobacter nosocomialis]|uniref:hypothetical protein n=1 Tax=Acinetobacter nosocomialis TaxID=106654 RepID=UPI00374EAD10